MCTKSNFVSQSVCRLVWRRESQTSLSLERIEDDEQLGCAIAGAKAVETADAKQIDSKHAIILANLSCEVGASAR